MRNSIGLEGIASHLFFKGVNTAILEMDYIDLEYWDDFSRCLVKEYYHLRKNCHRIVFFNFDEQTIEILKNDNNSTIDVLGKFQEAFLGYFVVRPLPVGFVSRTVLKPLELNDFEKCNKKISDLDRFPLGQKGSLIARDAFIEELKDKMDNTLIERCTLRTLRPHRINLFGLQLSVKANIYIERCPSAGVCASSSVYTTLKNLVINRLSNEFIISLSKITYFARNQELSNPAVFPESESGLTIKEIQTTFEKLNYRTHVWAPDVEKIDYPRLIITSYLASKIPVILVVGFVTNKKQKVGFHALTAVGFHRSNLIEISKIDKKGIFEDPAIDALVVQDDSRFPYSALKFKQGEENQFEVPIIKKLEFSLKHNSCQPPCEIPAKRVQIASEEEYLCNLIGIIIPVDDLVRLKVTDLLEILDWIKESILSEAINAKQIFKLRWEIDLCEIHRFRKTIIQKKNEYKYLSNVEILNLLQDSGPKYFWRCRAHIYPEKFDYEAKNPPIGFEIHFDASGIAHEISIRRILLFGNKDLPESIKQYILNFFNSEAAGNVEETRFARTCKKITSILYSH